MMKPILALFLFASTAFAQQTVIRIPNYYGGDGAASVRYFSVPNIRVTGDVVIPKPITFTPHVDGAMEGTVTPPVSILIPVPDGVTMTETNGILSCVQGAAALPAHVVTWHDSQFWDGATAILNPTFQTVMLSGGQTLQIGTTYGLTPTAANASVWTPIPTASTGTTSPTFISVSLPATAFAAPSTANGNLVLPQHIFAIPGLGTKHVISVVPPDGIGSQWMVDVTTTQIRVRNLSTSAGSMPAMVVSVVAF